MVAMVILDGVIMTIQYIDVRPQAGGMVRVTAVVDGDVQSVSKACEKAKQRPCELVIKQIMKKRSLDANAYYWVLLDKLVSVLRTDRKEIHRMMLARYGVTAMNGDRPIEIAMLDFIDPKELGDIYVDPEYTKDGMTVYRVLKGSHEMNSQEFSVLLDGVISECKELGIETLPDEELRRLFEVQKQ